MNQIVRWKLFFVALGAFVVGLTLGLLLVGLTLEQKVLNRISDKSFVELTDRLRILEHLRRADTNAAMEYAESRMMTDMITLAMMAKEAKDPKAARAYSNVLSRATSYRQKHGLHHADPDIEAMRAEIAVRFPAQVTVATNPPPAGNAAATEPARPPE